MSLNRLAGIMALLALACCDAPARGSSGPIIDTLPSGLRGVTKVPPWLDGSSRGLIQASEELRIGTGLSGGPEEFGVVSGLEVDGEGRIYVSDFFAHDVRVFHPDGAFSHAFGRKGEGPGELAGPYGLLLDPRARIWVREVRNMRFSLFERNGTFLEVIPIRHNTVGTWRAGFDRSGHLVEWAVAVAPDDAALHAARAEIYAARRKSELSLMAKGIYGFTEADLDAFIAQQPVPAAGEKKSSRNRV